MHVRNGQDLWHYWQHYSGIFEEIISAVLGLDFFFWSVAVIFLLIHSSELVIGVRLDDS